ncbi:MAG: hypothetical protein JWN70_3758 [Planctomycetaceae bacterium]|nr:hypothetical protein [Planctomycetaceae bacterium]
MHCIDGADMAVLKKIIVRPLRNFAMYPCPCCGYEVFGEPPGSFEICPICYWEDDIVQLAFPDLAGGANHCSLIEGQHNFATIGTCEARLKKHVRAPSESEHRNGTWRPLQSDSDRHLRWSVEENHRKWQAVKDSSSLCLYYWLPEYWLA